MAISPDALRNPNLGWKFHLNFDVQNQDVVERVDACARQLFEDGRIASYKRGDGGGVAEGQNRKEATLYAGNLSNALDVAAILERELGDVLLAPDRETMRDDLPMTASGKTWARFTAMNELGGKYHQYGSRGVCHLTEDMKPIAWGGEADPERAHHNALVALQADFRDFFTGPNFELGDILERAHRAEREGTRAVFGWDPAPDVHVGLDAEATSWWQQLPGASWAGAPHNTPAQAQWWEQDHGTSRGLA